VTYNPRKTKIVCTLGPLTESEEKVRALIGAGMDLSSDLMRRGSPGGR
jgi:pyruvate kinase